MKKIIIALTLSFGVASLEVKKISCMQEQIKINSSLEDSKNNTEAKKTFLIFLTQSLFDYTINKKVRPKQIVYFGLTNIKEFYKNNTNIKNYFNSQQLDEILLDNLKIETSSQFLNIVKLENILSDLFNCEKENLSRYINVEQLASIIVRALNDLSIEVYANDLLETFNLQNISEYTGIDVYLLQYIIISNFKMKPGKYDWILNKFSYLTSPIEKGLNNLSLQDKHRLKGACAAICVGLPIIYALDQTLTSSNAITTASTLIAGLGTASYLYLKPSLRNIITSNVISNRINQMWANKSLKGAKFSYDSFIESLTENQKLIIGADKLNEIESDPVSIFSEINLIKSLDLEQIELLNNILIKRDINRNICWIEFLASLEEKQESYIKVKYAYFYDLLNINESLVLLGNTELINSLNKVQSKLFYSYFTSIGLEVNISLLENPGILEIKPIPILINNLYALLEKIQDNDSYKKTYFEFISNMSSQKSATSQERTIVSMLFENLNPLQIKLIKIQILTEDKWNDINILNNTIFMISLTSLQLEILKTKLKHSVKDFNEKWESFITLMESTPEHKKILDNKSLAYKYLLGSCDINFINSLLNDEDFTKILTEEQQTKLIETISSII